MCSKTVKGYHCLETYVVFHRSNIGIMGSNLIQYLEVHLCFSLLVLRGKGPLSKDSYQMSTNNSEILTMGDPGSHWPVAPAMQT